MPFRILNIHHSIDMKVEAPRDTHLCGAWRCRAEKLQQQPQHWQSLHPNVATLHLQHRVYHVSHVSRPRPHLLCSARYVAPWTTGSLLPAAARVSRPRVRPWRCCGGTSAETRPRSRVESTRDTHTLTLLTCHTVTLVTGTAPYRSLSHTL